MAYLLNVILGTIVPMCVTALVTIAITIIFKTSSTTNFAQGVISAFGAYVVAAALNKLNLSLWLALPIGISFYTFQCLSYTIDVYRGRAHAEKNLASLATYVCLFPQLVAGPIVRYTTIADELNHRTHSNT